MLYKGTFTWYCETFKLYTHAKNEERAFSNFITQLSKILSMNRSIISVYFLRGSTDNWSIKEAELLKEN